MTEIFNRIFFEVCTELNAEGWWEVFDGEGFEEVVAEIADAMGITGADHDERLDHLLDIPEFLGWYNTMAEDL